MIHVHELEPGRVAKHAGEARIVGVQRPHLEVRTPRRIWRLHSQLGGRDEPEAGVVGGVAEQRDQRFATSVGGRDDRVHECHADASALSRRRHGEWAQTQRRLLADVATRADDEAHDRVARAVAADQGQLGDPRLRIGAQGVDELGLHGPRERLDQHR